MEQNHELPSSFQETERCFYVCRSGCGRIAFRHRYSLNALFRAYFPFPQYDAKLLPVQLDGGEHDGPRCTRTSRCLPGRRRGEGCGRTFPLLHRRRHCPWKQAVEAKYRYVLQTVNAQTHGDKVPVRARLTGEFPGSPVELDHIFKLSKDKIASLEIRS
jgi:hypothetical protein